MAAEPVVDLAAVEHDLKRGGADADEQRYRRHRSAKLAAAVRTVVRSFANAGGSCTKRLVRKRESRPIGMLMKKIQRQL